MNQLYTPLSACRISGSRNLVPILNLGEQAMTGIFPENAAQPVGSGPLELVWCPDSGLVQLAHSFAPSEMFGSGYGYRSGLNQSMVRHLVNKVNWLEAKVALSVGDVVLDIGSNDATTLKAYQTAGLRRIGVDPTGSQFASYYTDGIELVPDFFSAQGFQSLAGQAKAKIVTSISMFYDLEDPVNFARQVASVLDTDGLWHLEQSYLPSMLRANSYDTICHEHLEYYSLSAIQKIMVAAGLKVVDVSFNDVNGGSFSVSVAHENNKSIDVNHAVIEWVLEQENRMGLGKMNIYQDFARRVLEHRDDLQRLIRKLNAAGKTVLGYGASTKGNVMLQFCGFTAEDIPAIAEVNPDKFGHVTPGSHIPIVSEVDANAMNPDYYLVLPWHFRNSILQREQEFRNRGGKFIFPLPYIEII